MWNWRARCERREWEGGGGAGGSWWAKVPGGHPSVCVCGGVLLNSNSNPHNLPPQHVRAPYAGQGTTAIPSTHAQLIPHGRNPQHPLQVRAQHPRPSFPHGDYVGMAQQLATRLGLSYDHHGQDHTHDHALDPSHDQQAASGSKSASGFESGSRSVSKSGSGSGSRGSAGPLPPAVADSVISADFSGSHAVWRAAADDLGAVCAGLCAGAQVAGAVFRWVGGGGWFEVGPSQPPPTTHCCLQGCWSVGPSIPTLPPSPTACLPAGP